MYTKDSESGVQVFAIPAELNMSPAESSGQSVAVQSFSNVQFIASQSMAVQSVDGQSLSTRQSMESLSTGQQYTSVPSLSSPLMAGQSEPAPLSISFAASGFQATYQLGVAQSMLDLAPLVLQAAPKVMGASAGSLVAAALVCGTSLGEKVYLVHYIVHVLLLAEDTCNNTLD